MSDSESSVPEKKRGRGAAKAKTVPVKNENAAEDLREHKKRGRTVTLVKNDTVAPAKEAPKKDVSLEIEENSEPVVKKGRGRGRPPAKGKVAAKKKAAAANPGAKKGRGRPPATKKEEVKEEKIESEPEDEEEENEEEEE